ncbi:MAG: cation transporter, partial [Candidatus Magasanikbacteria bacterium]
MKKNLIISGMHCASCAVSIERSLQKQDGIKSASVNYAMGKAYIEFDESKVKDEDIVKAIASAGDYKIVREGLGEHHHLDSIKASRNKFVVSLILTLPLLVAMFFNVQTWFVWFDVFLSFIVVFVIGLQFHHGMILQLRRFKANMDTLVSVGTLSAFFYSIYAMMIGANLYFETAAVIVTLILLGKYLEVKSKGR